MKTPYKGSPSCHSRCSCFLWNKTMPHIQRRRHRIVPSIPCHPAFSAIKPNISCQGDSHSATSTGLSKRCELKLTHIPLDPTSTPESRRAHCDALHNTFMANLKAAEIAAGRSPLILSTEPVILSTRNWRQIVERKLMSCSSCTSQMESQLASISGDPVSMVQASWSS